MSRAVFGSLFSPHELEEAVQKTLEDWLPVYTQEVEEQYDGIELPSIETWGLENNFTEFPNDDLPAVIVAADGTGDGGEPEEHNAGDYKAGWKVDIVLCVHHPDSVGNARKIVQMYGAVVRGVMIQQRTLGGVGLVKKWTGESYPYEIGEHGIRAAAEQSFLVECDEVVNWRKGPRGPIPPPEPPGPYPVVKDTEVRTEIDE